MEPEQMRRLVGGFGLERDGSCSEVDVAMNAIRDQLNQRTWRKYTLISVVSFKEQTVAGKNYLMNVSSDDTFHVIP